MSWFDSSFSFAKSALNQAQKSIDKVLDIKESDVQAEIDPSRPSSVKATPTPSSPSPNTAQNATPSATSFSHSQSMPPDHQSHSVSQQATPATESPSTPGTVATAATPPFKTSSTWGGTTWGGADSFWGSPSPASHGKAAADTTKKSARQLTSSKSAESVPKAKSKNAEHAESAKTHSTKGAVMPPSKSAESAELLGTPPLQGDRARGVHDELSDPAMTSTPISGGGGKGRQQQKRQQNASGAPPGALSPQSPISPLPIPSATTTTTLSSDDGRSPAPFAGNPSAESAGEVVDGSERVATGDERSTATDKDRGGGGGDSGGNDDEMAQTGSETQRTEEGLGSPLEERETVCVVGVASEPSEETDNVAVIPPSPPATLEVSPSLLEEVGGSHVEEGASHCASLEASGQQVGSEGRRDKGEEEEEEGNVLKMETVVFKREGSNSPDNAVLKMTPQEEEMKRLKEELTHSQHVLEVREQKMVLMSQQLVEQMEANQTLQSELEELKGAAQTDVQEMREEFARRLGMSEKKLQAVIKERDSLKKQLTAFQNEQTQHKKSEEGELSRLLNERDEKISQLMEEGEKLSKQELQSNGIIKKLRSKERQNEQLLAAQRQQMEDLEGKVKSLKEQIKKKEENEKKYQESLGQLNTIAEQQARELASMKTEKEGLQDRVRSLQTNLDNSYKELAGLQKANAVNKSVAQEAAASAEKSKEAEVKAVLEQQGVAFQKEKESLVFQIEDLRMSISRAEQQVAWKEDHMNQEIANIQTRLQEAEDRNQELTSTISQATKPLLRQIENLQTAHSAQSSNWEKVEASLNQRLVEVQTQLNVALEKERSAVEKHLTLKSRVSALETQLSSIKQEKSQLLATVELERAKLETLEESQHRESSKVEALRASFQQSIEGLRKEKEMLERQLEYERVRLEAESRKACLESQEKERLKSQLANSLSSLNRSMSRQSSSGSQSDYPAERLQSQEVGMGRSENAGSDFPLMGAPAKAGSALVLERLHALLKQKEGELTNLQNLSSSLERSRAAMAEDLAKISAQNEVLNQQVEQIPSLEQELQEVRKKHEAMLQMYGEKAEEAEELKLDIQDLKSMYRQQIDELVGQRRL